MNLTSKFTDLLIVAILTLSVRMTTILNDLIVRLYKVAYYIQCFISINNYVRKYFLQHDSTIFLIKSDNLERKRHIETEFKI